MTVRRIVYQALDFEELNAYQNHVNLSGNKAYYTFDYEELRVYMTFENVELADMYCASMASILFRSWNSMLNSYRETGKIERKHETQVDPDRRH
jgi:hypothetical protein